MTTRVCAFQEWIFDLSMQQQSVLVLALRGADGLSKEHPSKVLLRRYRACILKSAHLGRALRFGEEVDSFHSLNNWWNERHWSEMLRAFFRNVDDLPLHFTLHLMHGVQILGYKHPDQGVRSRWGTVYHAFVHQFHLMPENEAEMDHRLGDWGREHWDQPMQVWNDDTPRSVPHSYQPSTSHMGDCARCGQTQDHPLHSETASG